MTELFEPTNVAFLLETLTIIIKDVVVVAGGVTAGLMTVSDDYNFSGGVITANTVTVTSAASLGLSISANAPALIANSVAFVGGSMLNITGYTPDDSWSPYTASRNIQTVVETTGGITGFNPNVKVAGQSTVDFLSASAFIDGNDIKVETRLRWYSTDPDRQAHGDFTIADGQAFTLGAVLGNNSASTNRRADWDGNSLTKYRYTTGQIYVSTSQRTCSKSITRCSI